ncbi:hypothetical protein ASE63_16405 [Bosea sp. Root381]|nr:hypothetical protein ASE63_16405 [Bosea sp. Root381]
MRRLPVGPASALGGQLARLKIRFVTPDVAEKARSNLRRHLPAAPDAELERMVWRFADNIGRLMAEFAISHRFAETGRIEMLGVEEAGARVGQMPTIALCLHVGNWEVVASALQVIGVPIASISEVPGDPLHREIADKTRKEFGVKVLAPDRNGARHALSLLRNNGTVAIFPDEVRDGRMMAPLFGRPPHLKGNLAVAAKLARRTGAQIVLGYCERVGGARFRVRFLPPYTLPPGDGDPLADVALLNDLIEPIVLKHLDQWYYLDDSLAPID